MTDKRFKSTLDEDTMSIMPYLVSDKEEECFYNLQGCVDLLNEQQATITNLQGDVERLKYIIEELRKDNYNKFELINKMKKEEKLYAKEILRLNELNKQTSEFTDILGGY